MTVCVDGASSVVRQPTRPEPQNQASALTPARTSCSRSSRISRRENRSSFALVGMRTPFMPRRV
jgi:hypothetical protein